MKYFHFTLGPVQSFVAQARRTRDFWAGSFLLSWLAGVAMLSVKKQNGKIEFPKTDEGYLKWIKGNGSGKKPRQGGIPNRFKAEVNDDFKPEIVIKNVKKAWKELADKVWEEDLARHSNNRTKEIWDRQINHFWEISWVLTEDEGASDLLDRRKNWRNYFAPDEPGVKCMMMVGWQELSGEPKPDEKKIKEFWQPIRERTGLDLREGEYLCAIAFVKRRFARHFSKLNKTPDFQLERSINQQKKSKLNDNSVIKQCFARYFKISSKVDYSQSKRSTNYDKELKSNNEDTIEIKGWKLETGIPSVSYMAAVHWLEKVIEKTEENLLNSLFENAKQAGIDSSEQKTDINCINQVCEKSGVKKALTKLDGQAFFINEIKNSLNDKTLSESKSKALKGLKKILETLKKDLEIEPSPFYAILMMDGDSLGSKMSKLVNQKTISKALKEFTNSVPNIVYNHNGFLIYAGGDDVLAVLPVEDVFECAIKIRECYQTHFRETHNIDIDKSTISAAVEFAHIKMPLTKILRDAHKLLNNVAKEGCGRDSVAVRVWKPGGTAIQWAMPWECALNREGKNLILEDIASKFREYDNKDSDNEDFNKGNSSFSNSFFYKIRERFELLNPIKNEPPILDEDQQLKLLATDYINAGNNKELNLETAEIEIEPLLNQCRRYKRDVDEPDKEKWKHKNRKIFVGGALLVRFLVNKGVEKNA